MRAAANLWLVAEKLFEVAQEQARGKDLRQAEHDEAERRLALLKRAGEQRQVADASHLVVMTVQKKVSAQHVDRFLNTAARVRNVPVESMAGYRKMMISDVVEGERSKASTEWAIRQAYIALGNFMTCAAMLGVDTCPMEGFEVARYDEILDLAPHGWTTAVLCPAGYRAATDR